MHRLSSACAIALTIAAVAQEPVPSPQEFLGHAIGEDHFLADYSQLVRYWTEIARRSDRMALEDAGETAYGQRQIVAVISSPENLARLEELRSISERLTLGRDVEEAVARELTERGRSVVWIDAGMHATEAVAAQNILELVWQMVSRDDAEVRRILDGVVLLVCPANPDGMEMIAKAYMATQRVGGIPVLYQRWIGHDNNRDHYAGNVPETRNIQRMLYRRWFPQVVYNHHQSAPRGTIIFTPPFRDPFNYNIDPLVVRGIELVSAHMNHRFSAEGKPGAISRSGASYSAWWNGGLRTTTYFHNMIGILTESFGSPNPTVVTQTLERRLPYGDYPDPVPTQRWHARQTIEYLQTANFAVLDLVARYRSEFLLNAWRMARRAIDRGSRDHWTPTPRLLAIAREREALAREAPEDGAEAAPAVVPAFEDPELRDARHYVIRGDQPDKGAVIRLVRRLRRCGVEVHRTTAPFALPWRGDVPEGSYVVHAAQAFRAHVRDMLEPQWHPDDLAGGEPVRPYDSAGWTLSMQMGVEVERVLDPLEIPAEPVVDVEVAFPSGSVTPGIAGWLVDHRDSNHYIAVNRLLAAGEGAAWLVRDLVAGGREWPSGSVFVPATAGSAELVPGLAQDLGVHFTGVDEAPPSAALRLRPVRIGLFDVYGGDMATGWTQWVLENWEFPVQPVFGARIERGALLEDFDVLVFHAGLPQATERGRRDAALRRGGRGRRSGDVDVAALQRALPPFEDWSTIPDRLVRLSAETSVPHLREFVEGGGTLIALGDEATALARHFELPVDEGLWVPGEGGDPRRATGSDFWIPGSLLAMDVDTGDPLGFGLDAHQPVMFRRSPVFTVEDRSRVDAPVSYAASGPLLASGWAIGEDLLRGKAVAMRAAVGEGQLYLFGADVVYRGQPVATFKLLFNAILAGPAERVASLRTE